MAKARPDLIHQMEDISWTSSEIEYKVHLVDEGGNVHETAQKFDLRGDAMREEMSENDWIERYDTGRELAFDNLMSG